MSPEHAQGLPLTPATDLYSRGVVQHRLVTGRLPFEGASPIAVVVAHVTAPAPAEESLAREMNPTLATIDRRTAPAQRSGRPLRERQRHSLPRSPHATPNRRAHCRRGMRRR